ncbi:MAG: SlyX family protein [Planctomycetota bacterium]
MSEALRRRIDELEATVGFQERKLEKLDGVVRELYERLDALVREQGRLQTALRDARDPGPSEPALD